MSRKTEFEKRRRFGGHSAAIMGVRADRSLNVKGGQTSRREGRVFIGVEVPEARASVVPVNLIGAVSILLQRVFEHDKRIEIGIVGIGTT
jgi:hypothetical protein